MIETKIIDARHKADINIPNEPFRIFGKIVLSYDGTNLAYKLLRFDSKKYN